MERPYSQVLAELTSGIRKYAETLDPETSLRFLLELDNELYKLQGTESVRHGNGVHSKHRHIGYHDFFAKNIPAGSKVLDIGCGFGALAVDVAKRVPGVSIVAIDLEAQNIEKALRLSSHPSIRYLVGDALKFLPDEPFDIIILSNVLEHLPERPAFLHKVVQNYKPRYVIIRVPLFERDWRVPLKKELGVDYRLDDTHYTEYLQDEFLNEVSQAGLSPVVYEIHWGGNLDCAGSVVGRDCMFDN